MTLTYNSDESNDYKSKWLRFIELKKRKGKV